MIICTVRHRGLKRFLEQDDPRELPPERIKRVRNVLAALLAADTMETLTGPPGWRIHRLTGDRAGTWSIAVSGNWRIAFALDGPNITDLDLEDYH